MKDSVILEGKIYISARRAARLMSYAQDYIGQLCRSNKLDCKMIGRSWFVTEASLLAHRENTIDGTQAKNVVTEKREIEKPVVAPPAPTVSPIQQGASSFKYEIEKKSLLPELRKNVPSAFALPKNLKKILPAPFLMERAAAPSHTIAVQTRNFSSTVIVIMLITVAGILFSFSMDTITKRNVIVRNDASVAATTAGWISKLLESIGLRSKPTTLATVEKPTSRSNGGVASTTNNLNGIGIFPATSPDADAEEKARIINSFSDEVRIMPDQGGTSGVITPVFNETKGDDFVYVLVPVKEEKK